MKRLLAQIGITYFSVLAAAFYLPQTVVMLLFAIALILTIIFFFVRKIRKTIFVPAMALAALLACAFHIGYTLWAVQPLTERYGSGVHTVNAVLTDESHRSYAKYYYKLKTTVIDGEPVRCKLMLKTFHALDAEPDDSLTFQGELNISENDYYRAKGYYLIADGFDELTQINEADDHSPYYYAIKIRQFMRRALNAVLDEDCASLCRAVLIGDKYAIDQITRDRFRYAGASYFIVISGMHFAVICIVFEKLLKRINRWVRMTVMMLFILVYAAITGFQPSVLRSAVMITVMTIGNTIRRKAYPLNHLGIAGIVIPFIMSPYGAGDIGLILSFYATMAILLWAAPIANKLCMKDEHGCIVRFQPARYWREKKSRFQSVLKKEPKEKSEAREKLTLREFIKKLYNGFALMLSVSLAANILVFPISVFVFHEVSLVTLLSSVLLYWEIYLILILALTVCVLFWCKPVILALAYPLTWLCRLVLWIVQGLSSFEFAFIRVSRPFIYLWMALTVMLGVLVILYRNNYRYLKLAAFCSALLLLTGAVTDTILRSQMLTLEVYSCGDGICAAVNDAGNLHILRMDAKSRYLYDVWDKLYDRYPQAQSALCCDADQIGNYQKYREDEFAISKLLLYDKEYEANDDSVIRFDQDSEVVLDDDLTLDIKICDGVPVPVVRAGESSILLLDANTPIMELSDEELRADIVILTKARSGMEKIHCRDLVICGEPEFSLRTAKALQGCYQNVYCTGSGDVRCRLR